MKTFKLTLLIVIFLLVLADIGWRVRIWHLEAPYRAQFKFERLYTNSTDVYAIKDARTDKLLLMTYDTDDGMKPGELSYFSQGRNVLNVYYSTNRPPIYRFIFHGPMKSEEWWMNIGWAPSFTTRVLYDTNGNRSDHEVWHAGTWHSVDRRNEHNGIIINGQWNQLSVYTNGEWTIKTESTNSGLLPNAEPPPTTSAP
jgi:hypothetical protein